MKRYRFTFEISNVDHITDIKNRVEVKISGYSSIKPRLVKYEVKEVDKP